MNKMSVLVISPLYKVYDQASLIVLIYTLTLFTAFSYLSSFLKYFDGKQWAVLHLGLLRICVLRHKCCDKKFLSWLPVINRSLKLVSGYFKFRIDWKPFKEFWIFTRSFRSNFTRLKISLWAPHISAVRTRVQKLKPKMAKSTFNTFLLFFIFWHGFKWEYCGFIEW